MMGFVKCSEGEEAARVDEGSHRGTRVTQVSKGPAEPKHGKPGSTDHPSLAVNEKKGLVSEKKVTEKKWN